MLAKKSERYIKISTSRNIYKFNFIDILNFIRIISYCHKIQKIKSNGIDKK